MAQKQRTLQMLTSDNVIVSVDIEVAEQMETIRDMLQACKRFEEDQIIPLDHVNFRILNKVIDWIRKTLFTKKNMQQPQASRETTTDAVVAGVGDGDGSTAPSEAKPNDQIVFLHIEPFFTWRWTPSEVFRLMLAANYLGVFSLVESTAQWTADQIANCDNTQQVRRKFHIHDDLTAAEERQLKREGNW